MVLVGWFGLGMWCGLARVDKQARLVVSSLFLTSSSFFSLSAAMSSTRSIPTPPPSKPIPTPASSSSSSSSSSKGGSNSSDSQQQQQQQQQSSIPPSGGGGGGGAAASGGSTTPPPTAAFPSRLYQHVLDLTNNEKRYGRHQRATNSALVIFFSRFTRWFARLRCYSEAALLELSKKREEFPDLAPILWHSFGTISALLQVGFFPSFVSPFRCHLSFDAHSCFVLWCRKSCPSILFFHRPN